jgi:hypothetical protein
MSNKTIFDLDCEALDLFFAHEIEKISPTAKSELPKDVAFKLFRGGGKFRTQSTSRLGFLAKLYILWKALNKRWWIVIEDEVNGITPGQFMELRKAYKRRDYSPERATVLKSIGSLVLASPELAHTMTYLNRLSGSGAYNYIMKGRNAPKSKTTEDDKERIQIAKFLANYDGQKKNIVGSTRLTMPEFYVLMTLFDGKEILGSLIYHEKFKRAYQSSPSKIKLAFGTLQSKGLITKTGVTRGSMMQITSSGKELLNSIFEKYILNY